MTSIHLTIKVCYVCFFLIIFILNFIAFSISNSHAHAHNISENGRESKSSDKENKLKLDTFHNLLKKIFTGIEQNMIFYQNKSDDSCITVIPEEFQIQSPKKHFLRNS